MSQPADTMDVAAAARTLALLNQQADEVRADIVRSRRELAKMQRDFDGTRAAQLLEANEQLVLAALQAETLAEAATDHLDELARSSQRDALTDTPNRALMLDRLENAIALARGAMSRASPCCFSTSTSSSRSTTRSAMRSVMRCCNWWHAVWSPSCVARTPSAATAATNFWCW